MTRATMTRGARPGVAMTRGAMPGVAMNGPR